MMRSDQIYPDQGNGYQLNLANIGMYVPRKMVIGFILTIALLAFEMFNFDTTQYALRNLLGDVRFLGLQWASILAIAFCSIDFAGLTRLFTPEKGRDEPKEVWYLMGAWLLGATMNAIMTWWAISLTLLNHDFGNEVLGRATLLRVVPIFVAVLVWLTRILFIGAFTVAGEHIFDISDKRQNRSAGHPTQRPVRANGQNAPVRPATAASNRAASQKSQQRNGRQPTKRKTNQSQPARPQRSNSRIRQRPPIPNGVRRAPINGMQARSREQN